MRVRKNSGFSLSQKLFRLFKNYPLKLEEKWQDYIYFASYRCHQTHPTKKDGRPWQEIVYPHSKLLIVDDIYTLIGRIA